MAGEKRNSGSGTGHEVAAPGVSEHEKTEQNQLATFETRCKDEETGNQPPSTLLQPLQNTQSNDLNPHPSPSIAAENSSESIWNEKYMYDAAEESQEKHSHMIDRDETRTPTGESSRSKAEIQSIMDQFGEEQGAEPDDTLGSPGADLPVFEYPPRVSSLDNLRYSVPISPGGGDDALSRTHTRRESDGEKTSLSYAASIRSQPPPPEPDPEPDLPFDFNRFLEQLRHRTADPVAGFLRSFLQEFRKKQWQVHEQVKIISDFLAFSAERMAQCEVWRTLSDAEFDNAKEGMEKLVMSRLYSQTFSPEIPPGDLGSPRGRKRGASGSLGPGRKGQHQEDVERDEVLAQKVRIYGWVNEEHLDINPAGDKGRRFLIMAQKELGKIQSYRAPRDKVICILNCCKVLFGYLKNEQSDQSADAFIPLLIYTVLKANPEHLVSNVQYILRFRHQDKLVGEAGYYMSSLMGAVQFIENIDRTSLSVSDEEFERNVEAAVSAIAEKHNQDEMRSKSPRPQFNEKSTLSRPEVDTRNSMEGERSSPRRLMPQRRAATKDDSDDSAASGLLRTIQKPLSSFGRIFSDETGGSSSSGPAKPPLPARSSEQIQPNPLSANEADNVNQNMTNHPQAPAAATRENPGSEVAEARQASMETAQAQRLAQAEHQTVVETLSGMFPDLDRDVISDVVRMKEGRVGLAVDACLALSH